MAKQEKPQAVTGEPKKPADLPPPNEPPKDQSQDKAAIGKPVAPPPEDAAPTPSEDSSGNPAADVPAQPETTTETQAPAPAATKNFGDYLLQQEVDVAIMEEDNGGALVIPPEKPPIKVFVDIQTSRKITSKADGIAYVKEESLAGRYRIIQKKAVFTSGAQTTFKIKEEK